MPRLAHDIHFAVRSLARARLVSTLAILAFALGIGVTTAVFSIFEIAIAFTLLVGAGRLVKNLVLLRSRDAGLRTERIATFDIAPSGPRYQADDSVVAFYRDLHGQLARIDLLESAGMTTICRCTTSAGTAR